VRFRLFFIFKVLKRAREFDKNAVDRTGQICQRRLPDSRAAGKAVLHEGEYSANLMASCAPKTLPSTWATLTGNNSLFSFWKSFIIFAGPCFPAKPMRRRWSLLRMGQVHFFSDFSQAILARVFLTTIYLTPFCENCCAAWSFAHIDPVDIP